MSGPRFCRSAPDDDAAWARMLAGNRREIDWQRVRTLAAYLVAGVLLGSLLWALLY